MSTRQVSTDASVTPENWWDGSIDSPETALDGPGGIACGTLIGHYRVLSALGAGGMGEVVLAERADETFSQRVAIKLVRGGLVTRQVQSRLKVERQILATLDHPNIAKLLDGGATANGTPYIVMEYIDGLPIDVYCDLHKLTLRERLTLFRTICLAVHYAHQNLVVHRDLKPSNILVTPEGVPKLLDFGIAKVLDARKVMHTMAVTQADVRLMTPDHASPEQIQGEPITTSSDIYSLGVLLYELLTGFRPYAAKMERLSEMERAICEDPPLPLDYGLKELRASSDTQALRELCENRSIGLARLRRELRGDIGNIVFTALRKEPERRYPSVEQFSTDIGRLLDERPVMARSDTWTYRLQMFVRRYKYGVAAAATALIALIAFTVSTIIQNERIARERARAEQISSFLVELFERADPSQSRGSEITVREMLDMGARRMESGLTAQPEVRANLLATMGTVYGSLGLYDEAVALLASSLQSRMNLYGSDSLEAADAMQRLGTVLVRRGEYARAEALLQQALSIDRRRAGDDRLRIAATLHEFANLRRGEEKFKEAEQLFRESLSLLDRSSADAQLTIQILNDYGLLLDYTGNQAAAEQTYRRAIDLSERTLGPDQPDIADITHNLADTLSKQGRIDAAGPLFIKSLALYRKLLGSEHPFIAMALANYGRFLQQSGDFDAADSTLREALHLNEKVRGPDHALVGYDHGLLGYLLLERNQPDAAATEFRTAIGIYGKSLPANHLYVGAARSGLGRALVDMGRAQEGEVEIRQALDIFRSALGGENSMVGIVEAGLGRAIAQQGRLAEAEPLLRKGYVAALQSRGVTDRSTSLIRKWIEELYAAMGQPEGASRFIAEASHDKAARSR